VQLGRSDSVRKSTIRPLTSCLPRSPSLVSIGVGTFNFIRELVRFMIIGAYVCRFGLKSAR